MADSDLSAALSGAAHPQAKPGFGKRTPRAEGEPERTGDRADFAHLSQRGAYLAAYIDRLPEGAAIDVKTLAKAQPLYGQMAVRSALRELTRAGHLRRIGGLSGGPVVQHVTRTYFSRAARDDAWWFGRLGRVPERPPEPEYAAEPEIAAEGEQEPEREREPVEVQPAPPRAARPRRAPVRPAPVRPEPARTSPAPAGSAAYEALAVLGQRDPRLVLSASDCTRLEPLAARWHERGVCGERFAVALTSGLPPTVHDPAALLRRRLLDKLPPEPAATPPEPVPEVRRWLLECQECGLPGRPEALREGLCGPCRDEPRPPEAEGRLTAAEVGDRSRKVRDTLRAGRTGRSRPFVKENA